MEILNLCPNGRVCHLGRFHHMLCKNILLKLTANYFGSFMVWKQSHFGISMFSALIKILNQNMPPLYPGSLLPSWREEARLSWEMALSQGISLLLKMWSRLISWLVFRKTEQVMR